MTAERRKNLFRELDSLAPDGYNFGFHVHFSRPSLVRLTYNESWSRVYSARKFILNDPSVIWGLTQDEPRRWSEIDLPDILHVFETASEYGYPYGIALGCGTLEERSFGSCGKKDREFSDEEISRIHQIILELHDIVGSTPLLTERQKTALTLFHNGQTYDQICEELDISRTALRSRLTNARRVLGAETNIDAARIAFERGLIETTSYTGIVKGYPPTELA